MRTDALSVWVGYKDGRGGQGVGRLATPSDDFFQLLDAARQGLRRAYRPGVLANRMHLITTRLERPGARQQGLFDEQDERAATIAQLKREVNAECGRFALRSGATLPLQNGDSPALALAGVAVAVAAVLAHDSDAGRPIFRAGGNPA